MLLRSQPNQPMINLFGLVMFAVHIEQHPRPNLAELHIKMKGLHPKWFDQKEIQVGLCAMPLDAVDEKIIRIQLMRHGQIIYPLHSLNYLVSKCRLSTFPEAFLLGARVFGNPESSLYEHAGRQPSQETFILLPLLAKSLPSATATLRRFDRNKDGKLDA